MLLSVDHGNKFIKTPHTIFTSGLYPIMSEQYGTESLKWEQHFALSEQRMPYMYDKTIDDRYFVLTLFALAKSYLKMIRTNKMTLSMLHCLLVFRQSIMAYSIGNLSSISVKGLT